MFKVPKARRSQFHISAVGEYLLGGPWDLVTTYSWDYNPTYNWGNPLSPFRGIIRRVISLLVSSY